MVGALVVMTVLGAVAPLDPTTGRELHVWLDGHRGAFTVSGDKPVLTFQALAHSNLDVPVEAIEVGILFAREQAALGAAMPGELYERAASAETHTVGVVRQWVEVDLSAGEGEVLHLDAELSRGDPEPVAWVTHVLRYRLADVNLELLRELVSTDVFADEAAVVETLALSAGPERKVAVRARWGGRRDLVQGLADLARAPVPVEADIQVAIERVMAVRALGVLGGELAEAALGEVASMRGYDALGEPLMVMGIARLSGSPLRAPMAYAVPAETHRMSDVVQAALGDLPGWELPSRPNLEGPATPALHSSDNRLWVAGTIAAAVVLALVLVMIRRRHRG